MTNPPVYVVQWEVGRGWMDLKGMEHTNLKKLKRAIEKTVLLESSSDYRIIKRTVIEEVVKD